MIDDSGLVAQSQQGNTAAFSELLQRHDGKMRGVVWRLVSSPTDMDDVLQDAYLKAWRGINNFRGDAAFSSWLYRIVYTSSLDHLKASARRRVVPFDDLIEQGLREPSVNDGTAALVDSFALRQALASLPLDQLAVVTLVDGQGESYDEVAALLDISSGTVGSRLSRARAALRRELTTDPTTTDPTTTDPTTTDQGGRS